MENIVEMIKEWIFDPATFINNEIECIKKLTDLIKNEFQHDVKIQRELFDNFYKWLDNMTEQEYDSTCLTDKCEIFFFKNKKTC